MHATLRLALKYRGRTLIDCVFRVSAWCQTYRLSAGGFGDESEK